MLYSYVQICAYLCHFEYFRKSAQYIRNALRQREYQASCSASFKEIQDGRLVMWTLFRFCFPSGPAAVSVVYRSPQDKNRYCVVIHWFYYFFSLPTSKCTKIILSECNFTCFSRSVFVKKSFSHKSVTVTHRRSAPLLAAAILLEPATRFRGAVRLILNFCNRDLCFSQRIYFYSLRCSIVHSVD